MKKRVNLLFMVVLTLIISFYSLSVYAADDQSSYGYKIEKYDVSINVKKNNVLEIKETITTNFISPRHGIIRKIPLKNTVIRNDGSTTKNSVRLTDLNVSETYSVSNSSGYKSIKIGDADETITGLHEYVISYNYNLGKDPNKKYDELYFNIIGTEWDTEINNVTFTVNMPDEFDQSKLGFSTGKYGHSGHDNVIYYVDENKISGSVVGKLGIGEGLNIRCELPDGYFVDAGISLPLLFPLMFIIPLVGAVCAYLLWNKYGKDDVVIETVEFYPPNDCNSAEAAFFYKSSLSSNDANSLLIYLASKGYLKIVEEDKKHYRIEKLKDYDGNKDSERIFMEGLFASKNVVTKDDLYDKFYKTIEKVRVNVDNVKTRAMIYDKKASSMIGVAALIAFISLVVTVMVPTLDFGTFEDLFPSIFFGCALTLFLALDLFALVAPLVLRIVLAVPIVVIGSLFISASDSPIYYSALSNKLMLFAIIFGFIMTLVICFFVRYMNKRTPYGNEMYGRIKGFRNFLLTAEKEKLEALVEDDPSYFYNILPFTYALGLSDKWIKKFEDITISEPDWYEGRDTFTMRHLDHFLLSTMSSSIDRVVETSSSSSGGGFSGGGFSGGGSGGGGGSSW